MLNKIHFGRGKCKIRFIDSLSKLFGVHLVDKMGTRFELIMKNFCNEQTHILASLAGTGRSAFTSLSLSPSSESNFLFLRTFCNTSSQTSVLSSNSWESSSIFFKSLWFWTGKICSFSSEVDWGCEASGCRLENPQCAKQSIIVVRLTW